MIKPITLFTALFFSILCHAWMHAWMFETVDPENEVLKEKQYQHKSCYIQDLPGFDKIKKGYVLIYSEEHSVAVYCDKIENFYYSESGENEKD